MSGRRPIDLILAVLLLTLAAAAVPSLAAAPPAACVPTPESQALVGVWESRETTRGGLGIIMEFRQDGGWVDTIGAIVDTPSSKPATPTGTVTFPYANGIPAYERQTAEGISQFRLPFPKPWGCYQVVGSKLRLCRAGCPPEEVDYKVTATTLEITGKTSGKKTTLHRVDPAWYRPPNEQEVAAIQEALKNDPEFQKYRADARQAEPPPVEVDLPVVKVPRLLSPADDAIVDNGCLSRQDDMTWEFDWAEVRNAARYRLIVQRVGAAQPVIDLVTRESFHRATAAGGYVIDSNRYGWEWKVQAEIDGVFDEFSMARAFDVEPVDTDCR
ncbi:MAG: hypothetical protein FDZ69_14130 [Deltaproteobacteria bacterium]|nr:MAG: hypothetical protein FDZ69_14130 [Deltaproteobacteria bacterium]